MTQLKDILVKSEEQIEVKPECRYRQVTVKLWGKGVILRNEVFGSEIAAPKRHVLRFRDFLISKIDARNGAFGLVPDLLDGSVVSSDFPVFKLDLTRIYPRFLEWMSRSNRFIDICKASSEGTTNRVRLKEDRFLASEIPLPSLDEQRRIVARIEELVARIEEAQELRRRAVEETNALMNNYGDELFHYDGCSIESIDSICEVRGGIQKSSERTPGSNPRRYITVAHVQRNWIDTSDPRYFEVSDEELEKWRLIPGDVLVIEGNGSADQIGRTALFSGEIRDCVHQNHVIRIRPNQKWILPDYLNGFLNSPHGQKQMRERSRTTSGLFNLSVGRIKSINIPLPSVLEQQIVIDKLQEMRSKLDALKRHQAETAAELDALLPAILERAFRGEL